MFDKITKVSSSEFNLRSFLLVLTKKVKKFMFFAVTFFKKIQGFEK
jgi:hypothetical protein